MKWNDEVVRMSKTIALAGKGGTGKTTIAALLIHSLTPRIRGPLLAVDADPASNLHMALGMPMPTTLGEIREQMASTVNANQLGVSISRQEYLDREVRMALEEGRKVDLIAMGRPEGQGCYCAFNHLLRQIMDNLSRSYEYIIIDNEAGMEHLSRRTTRDVDLLLLVTDPTMRGVHTVSEMIELSREVEINVERMMLVVNRVQDGLPKLLQEAIEGLGIEVAAVIPADDEVNQLDAMGQPLVQLNGSSPALQAMETLTTYIESTL
jgi:CO dehydrogenase maturation factor